MCIYIYISGEVTILLDSKRQKISRSIEIANFEVQKSYKLESIFIYVYILNVRTEIIELYFIESVSFRSEITYYIFQQIN